MKFKSTLALLVVGFLAAGIIAQEPQPQAALRLGPDCLEIGGAENVLPDKSYPKCYVVELYMPESMDRQVYGSPLGDKICRDSQGNKITCPAPNFAVLFNGKTLSQYPLEISPNDVALSNNRRNRLFVIYLPKEFAVNKPLQVMFDSYYSVNGTLRFPTAGVGTDFKVDFFYDSYNKIITQRIELNDLAIKCDDVNSARKAALDAQAAYEKDPKNNNLKTEADDAKANLAYVTGCNEDIEALKPNYTIYRNSRLIDIRNWLKKQDTKTYQIRAEDLNKCIRKDGRGCISFSEEEDFIKSLKIPDVSGLNDTEKITKVYYDFLVRQGRNPAPLSIPPSDEDFVKVENMVDEFQKEERAKFQKGKNLTVDDLKQIAVDKVETFPEKNNQIYQDGRILANYNTKNSVPSKFNMQLSYAKPAPFEISRVFKVTAQEMTAVTVNTKEDTGKAGERERPNRLDVGVLFGTSVGEKKEVIDGIEVKNIKRTTRGTLDLRISPLRPIGKGEWFTWEPVFLDAKISNGKIDEETLSLNRVVIGMSFDFTKFIEKKNSISSNPTYLNFSLKPVQASDRDFKQLEYKVIGEFQPRLAFLNRIPANFRSTVNSVITKAGETKTTRFVAPAWGYKIQPAFGGEIGKTWLRRNPAEVIEPTNYIKRLYTGIDMTFYMPLNMSLSISDKFYWNFGKDRNGNEVDGQENYFKTSLDIGIRKNQGFGDSIYFSFEKGNQPPFGPRDINAFKIGYRFVNPRGLNLW